MDHLGADRLIDPALTGMLLGIRRGLIEEMGAVSMSDFVLIDMAVIGFASAMRVQSMIGNTALVLESEMFGQPTLGEVAEGSAIGQRISAGWQSRSTLRGCGRRCCRWRSGFLGWRRRRSPDFGGNGGSPVWRLSAHADHRAVGAGRARRSTSDHAYPRSDGCRFPRDGRRGCRLFGSARRYHDRVVAMV